eukprot:scaffold9412_cov17-Tisochrysis_lutea.AAC.1
MCFECDLVSSQITAPPCCCRPQVMAYNTNLRAEVKTQLSPSCPHQPLQCSLNTLQAGPAPHVRMHVSEWQKVMAGACALDPSSEFSGMYTDPGPGSLSILQPSCAGDPVEINPSLGEGYKDKHPSNAAPTPKLQNM